MLTGGAVDLPFYPVWPEHVRGDGAVSTPTTTKDMAQYVEVIY